MTASSPIVSIIVVQYKRPELTAALIKSIKDFTPGIDYGITVVFNDSEPESLSSLNLSEQDIRRINPGKNLGFARACNLAADGASAKYLLFANPDCRLTSPVIPEIIRYLENEANCVACSPRLISENGATHPSLRRFPSYRNIRRSRGSILGLGSEYTIEADQTRKTVEAAAATFMMVKRELFEQVGCFDERYYMYVEDTDLCKKFNDIGMRVVHLGDLSVIHRWGASTRLNPLRMKFEHHLSVAKYFFKHYPHRWPANFFLCVQLTVNLLLVSVMMLFVRRE